MSSLTTPAVSQLFLAPGPRDEELSSLFERVQAVPYPPGPTSWPFPLDRISTSTYEWTLQAWVPILFSLIYYIVAHAANHFLVGEHIDKEGRAGAKDYTKGAGPVPKLLRFFVILHNAFLAIYSGWTFYHMLPVVLRSFITGFRADGLPGLRLALCSMPTNTATLAPYAWLFYISKYYEVVDSMILVLKGKVVSNLQSYHHAGALLAMWIAYRYQATPVWVFVTFNSAVHTAMYSYYLCSAMKWPFPKQLKRNLTTLQILQLSSGVFITNLYWFTQLQPTETLLGLSKLGVTNAVKGKSATEVVQDVFTATQSSFSYSPGRELFQSAASRASSRLPGQCLQYSGSALALHFNTTYLLPLIVLFLRFFVRSYSKKTKSESVASSARKAEAALEINGVAKANGTSTCVNMSEKNKKR